MNETCQKQTVADVFKCLMKIGYKASGLYDKLSMLFSYAPDISLFWSEMAKDGIFHINTLHEIYESLSKEQQLLSCHEEQIWKDIIVIQDLLVTSVIDSINNLDDAYDVARQIESSSINSVFKLLAEKLDLPVEQEDFVLSNLVRQRSNLTKFAQIVGAEASRMQISTKA